MQLEDTGAALDLEHVLSRRDLLAWLGAAGLAVVAGGCASGTSTSTVPGSSSSSSTPGSAASCMLSPELTEGPYYISGEAVRSDITEGKAGVPLRLSLNVVNASSCAPISGATVEVWHADAGGDYSGFGNGASSRTFLRGAQVAGADGAVTFQTIYPGWYVGRAVHIHLKVHIAGNVVHTGQLFFDEQVSDGVYARSPYSSRTGQRTTNAQDSIYTQGGAQTLQLAAEGDGYRGTCLLGVQQSS